MKKAILIAIKRLGVLRFFPSDSAAQGEIMRTLQSMVSDERQLEWLVQTLIDSTDEWCGLRSLRGLFCVKFRPRDGKKAECEIPGFRGEDCEAARALEARRLLTASDEMPMNTKELEAFHNELFTLMLQKRQPPSIDRESLRRAEQEISQCKPTLTEEEKRRRIEEIEAALGYPKTERGNNLAK